MFKDWNLHHNLIRLETDLFISTTAGFWMSPSLTLNAHNTHTDRICWLYTISKLAIHTDCPSFYPWGNISYKTRRSTRSENINLKSIAAARQKKGVMSFTTATLKQSKPLHREPNHSCKETTYVGQSKQTQRGKDEGGTVRYEWGSEPKGGEGGCREIFWKYDMKEKTERKPDIASSQLWHQLSNPLKLNWPFCHLFCSSCKFFWTHEFFVRHYKNSVC